MSPLQEFVSLAFSGDGRYLAAQGGAPDWMLSLWIWEKSKLVASVRTATAAGHTAAQCLFQPGAPGGVLALLRGQAVPLLTSQVPPKRCCRRSNVLPPSVCPASGTRLRCETCCTACSVHRC